METIVGRVLMLGNNVDTDQIYPGRHLSLVDPKEIATHCLEDVDKNIAKTFRDGDIVVAGKNFGCGSSREHAPIALKNMGVSLIIAESFARIFYRNSLNIGLPLMICKKMTKSLNNDDYISVNLKKGELLITSTGELVNCEAIDEYGMKLINAGGIKKLFAENQKRKEGRK